MEYKDTINLPNTDFSMRANLPPAGAGDIETLGRYADIQPYYGKEEKRREEIHTA